jgi:Na+/alanine symporter
MDCIFFDFKTYKYYTPLKTEFNLILPYLVGVVKDKRTIWRLSIISNFFGAIVNFVRMFFLTMFSVSDKN